MEPQKISAFEKSTESVENLFTVTTDSSFPHTQISRTHSQISEEETPPSSLTSSQIPDFPSFCTSKSKSKEAQIYISRCHPQKLQKVISILTPYFSSIMTDPTGNFFCQTLFLNSSSYQRLHLLKEIEKDLIIISQDPKGTHALQVLVTLANMSQQAQIYQRVFTGHILKLCRNLYASHVIQKMLDSLNNRYFIIREIQGHVKELACDKIGMCVIKRCINDPQILSELLSDVLVLIQDPYGNYAVQQAISFWHEECQNEILYALRGRVVQMSIQKFASNVIEKCLNESSMKSFVLNELVQNTNLNQLLTCPYGLYVMRTAAKVSDPIQRNLLKHAIKVTFPPGKRIPPKIQSLYSSLQLAYLILI